VSEATQTPLFLRALGLALGLSLGAIATAPAAAAAQGTLTVDSNADSAKLAGSGASCRSQAPGNPCTLRAAIETVNGFLPAGSTIDVPAAYSGAQAIRLTLGQLDLTRSQAIESTGGPGSATVDAQGASRVIQVAQGASVTLSGLTISHGSPRGDGGGIRNQGSLALSGVLVRDNQVSGFLGGGVYTSGAVTMKGGAVTGNQALASPGGGSGGGVYVSDAGSLTAAGTSFTGNTAGAVGGGIRDMGAADLDAVTVSGNSAAAGGGIAIRRPGSLQLKKSTVSRNLSVRAAGTGGGGGLLGEGGTSLTMVDSLLAGNSAGGGAGGGMLVLDGSAALSNDTLSDNSATVGGAIAQGGEAPGPGGASSMPDQTVRDAIKGISSLTASEKTGAAGAKEQVRTAPGTMTPPDAVALQTSTAAGNSATFAGGLFNQEGRMFTVHSSIVAGNAAPPGSPNCSSTLTSLGYNLESAAECGFTATGDMQSANPMLGVLGANGGPTQTLPIVAASPAIDAGDPACAPSAGDQRGVSRPQGARCDIGAFEAVLTTPAAAAAAPEPPRTGRRTPIPNPAPAGGLILVWGALTLAARRRRRKERARKTG
jgi:hypothetical protein